MAETGLHLRFDAFVPDEAGARLKRDCVPARQLVPA
jgi:hypothetical protein